MTVNLTFSIQDLIVEPQCTVKFLFYLDIQFATHITIIGIYWSPRVPIRQMCVALIGLLTLDISGFKVFIGDFNINWLNEKDKIPLYNLFIRDHSYRQLVSCSTTNNRTTIDHVYTNLPESQIHVHILHTHFIQLIFPITKQYVH